jgi:hypothetical protein
MSSTRLPPLHQFDTTLHTEQLIQCRRARKTSYTILNHHHPLAITPLGPENMIKHPSQRNLLGQVSRFNGAKLISDSLLRGLSWLDRFLAPLVLLAMILGVVIGSLLDSQMGRGSADK